jgi:hypothetical protein
MTNNANKFWPDLNISLMSCVPQRRQLKWYWGNPSKLFDIGKILPKGIWHLHGVTILEKTNIHASPRLPTLFVIEYLIRALAKGRHFSMNKKLVFKQGLIWPGIGASKLDNVIFTKSTEFPLQTRPLKWIYDIKPQYNTEEYPLGLHSFLTMVFSPRNWLTGRTNTTMLRACNLYLLCLSSMWSHSSLDAQCKETMMK